MAMETKFELPAGYRFRPTDVEVLAYYLVRLISKSPLPHSPIIEIDNLYGIEPWRLAGLKENETAFDTIALYFFTMKQKQLPTARCGYWKVISEENVFDQQEKFSFIGIKTALIFTKNQDSEETDWIMYEYKLPSEHHEMGEEWVICVIELKSQQASQEEEFLQDLEETDEEEEIQEEEIEYMEETSKHSNQKLEVLKETRVEASIHAKEKLEVQEEDDKEDTKVDSNQKLERQPLSQVNRGSLPEKIGHQLPEKIQTVTSNLESMLLQ